MRHVALLVLMCAACGDESTRQYEAAMEAHVRQDHALLTSVWDVLHHPDHLELLTLSHDSAGGEHSDVVTPTSFHNYPILGRAEITDPAERSVLVDGFYQSSREGDGEMLCFMPHHGLHATRGAAVVDLVICFHCLLYELYDNAGEERPETELSRFAQPLFMQVALAHNLPAEFDSELYGNETWGAYKAEQKMLRDAHN